MTPLHEELISRYVDGDLNAPEAAQARILIETDPAVRALFDHYSSISLTLSQLPRPEVPVDMVSRLEPFTSRASNRRWPFWRDISNLNWWLAGAAVASVSGITAALLLWPGTQPEPRPSVRSKMLTVEFSEAKEPAKPLEETQQPKLETAVASKSAIASAVEMIKPGPAAGLPETKPALPLTPVDQFVNQLARVDRRHSIRLHVEAANKRVEDEVLRALARFRGAETEVMQVALPPDVDTTGLRYLALVPTRSVRELIDHLVSQFGNQMELDLPDDLAWLRQNPGRLRPVGIVTINADDVSMQTNQSKDVNGPRTQKIGPDADPVPDALARPLERPEVESSTGTMDEVMIQIRTDLLLPAAAKKGSTKSKNRPVPENRK